MAGHPAAVVAVVVAAAGKRHGSFQMIQRALAAFLLLAASFSGAQAYERITRFASDVEVQQNGDLLVTETITVEAELRDIRRGILRDFPTTYQLPDGRRVVIGFDVLSVTRDGKVEPFSTESLSNGVRTRIGSANMLLARGPHTYVIKYRTTRQVGFFADYDELYWNVTGTGWTFDIDQVEASITLPNGAKIQSNSFYTGAQGEKGKDARVVGESGNIIVFVTTTRLPARNGLTVAVAWQKGIVAPPNKLKLAWHFVTDNIAQTLSILGLALVAFYFSYQWLRYGRDPAPGTIIPVFDPPAGMSAAAMRYVDREAYFDDKTFTAAIVELGVKGHIQLKEEKGVTRIEKRDGGKPLYEGEEAVLRHFFPKKGKTLDLTKANHARVGGAQDALKMHFKRLYDGLFLNNYSRWAWGLFLTFIAVVLSLAGILTGFSGRNAGDTFLGTLLPIIPLLLASFALHNGLTARRDNGFLITLGVIFGIIPAAIGLWYVWRNADGIYQIIPTAATFAAVMVCAFFLEWMEAPTKQGRKLLDHIEGFRDYLGTADEERRLEYLNPPEKTPELFERMLPYAIALDVENSWAKKFAAVLAAAAAAPAAAATGAAVSTWYSGNRDWSQDPAGLTSKISNSTSPVVVSSSSSSPGSSGGSSFSSSGSSGGGSSGGGGGGGGGSGW